MHFRKLKQGIILPVLAILVTSTILRFPSGSDRYVYSQSSKTNSTTANSTSSGADLINIHPSPTNLKAGSKFEVFVAGACHSPLSAFFYRNVLIRHIQGCTATSPPFKLDPGKEVTVAGPGSGTIYQTISSGQTRATATLYYQIEHGEFANITKSFLFTIS